MDCAGFSGSGEMRRIVAGSAAAFGIQTLQALVSAL